MTLMNAAPQAVSFWAMLGGGLLAFLSPCVLPMLPIYAIYLMSGTEGGGERLLLMRRCLGLLVGFILPFVLLGAGAGAIGSLLKSLDRRTLDIASGVLMLAFGLWLMDVIKINVGHGGVQGERRMGGFLRSLGFGVLLAISWTPCMTPLLSNALVMAATADNATMWTGIWMLGVFALGISLPMLAVMLLYQWLKGALGWLRERQTLIRRIGGGLMIAYGAYLIVAALVR